MKRKIIELLKEQGIDLYGAIPLSECRITKKYLLDREGICDGTAVIFAIPYLSPEADDPERNISSYAVARDYHLFISLLADDVLPKLRDLYPDNKFALFADHSPIDERDAAAKAGLGMIGCNHLLITRKYSSYVFIAELMTDAILESNLCEITYCPECGRCADACPSGYLKDPDKLCLSALTQKKGLLTPDEEAALDMHRLIWGCDQCQSTCPQTLRAKADGTIYTNIAFFKQKLIKNIDPDSLEKMSESEFAERAYSWRGREVLKRNLQIKNRK